MTMEAIVLQVFEGSLLVRDLDTGEEVLVNHQEAGDFAIGDNIIITYDGRMTLSIPPQIFATSIEPLQTSEYTETIALVLQVSQGSLLALRLEDNTLIRVNYAHANHFCIRQQVNIKYDSIILGNPIEINAIDITPTC